MKNEICHAHTHTRYSRYSQTYSNHMPGIYYLSTIIYILGMSWFHIVHFPPGCSKPSLGAGWCVNYEGFQYGGSSCLQVIHNLDQSGLWKGVGCGKMSLSASEILSKESSIIRQPTPRSLKRSKSSSCTLEKEIKRGTVSDMSCSYTDRTGSGCCNLWTQAEYGCSRFGSRESYGVIRVMRVIRVTAFNPLCGRSLAILMQLMMLIHVDMLTC